ncbi:MAG: hypothetical protein SW019_26245, partial [Actinomycetota bacterium]|nr:hypothetical protein [Actinomycetota bacterium]
RCRARPRRTPTSSRVAAGPRVCPRRLAEEAASTSGAEPTHGFGGLTAVAQPRTARHNLVRQQAASIVYS